MLVHSVSFNLPVPSVPAPPAPTGEPLDVVQVGGRQLPLHTRQELETYLYLTGQGEDGPRVDPRARQLQSMARDGCSFAVGGPVEAYYSSCPVTVLFQDQPVTELPEYRPPEPIAEKLPYAGTELEGPFHEMFQLTGDLGKAEEALKKPELAAFYRELGEACPEEAGRLARASRHPLRDRALLLAAAPYPEPDRWFRQWSEIKPEDHAAFLELVGSGLPAPEALPAWQAVASDRQQLQPRLKVWQDLARDLGDPAQATRILQNHPEGDPSRRLNLLHKLLADMEPQKALEMFEKVHGSAACHRLHQVSRQPARVEAARQWLERDDLVDAGVEAEERLSTLAELTEAHQGDLEQAQRDYLFVASRSDDWDQMQAMASFLARLRGSCPDGREARLAFAALDLLPPDQAGPRADNLLRSFSMVGTFAKPVPCGPS